MARTAVSAGMLAAVAPASASEFHPVAGAPDNGNTADGICTLREALTAANETTPQPDCNPATGSGTDTIVLSAGTYDLGGPAGEDANASGDLDVRGDVVINGAGAGATTINGHGADRIFDIYGGITATISGVTLTGGRAPNGANGTTSVGDDGESGGAIRAAGNLTLDDVTLSGNRAGDGGTGGTSGSTGLNGGSGGRGGAVDATGSLVVRNSTLSDNQAGNGGTGGASGGAVSDTAGNGGQGGRAGAISATAELTIENSTITANKAGTGGTGGSSATGTPGGGGSGGFGGGINSAASLTISHSTISANQSGSGGSAGPVTNNGASGGGFAGPGGGIAASVATGEVHISDSVIADNRSGDGGSGPPYIQFAPRGADGGGFWLSFGKATIERTTVSGNRTGNGQPGSPAGGGGHGGGIAVIAVSSLTLRDSTVSGNATGNGALSQMEPGSGGNGGGIFAEVSNNQSVALTNDTVTGNTTGTGGDATASTNTVGGHGGIGGGLYVYAKADVTHVTVAGNQTGSGGKGEVPGARGPGGGIHFADGTETLTNSIVASNSPSNCNVAAATLTDGGHNVSFPDTTCPGIGGDPLLQALADNGGPTQTMALGEGSSAIDIVPADAGCAPTDQRGTPRPQRAACDAGAYEATPAPTPVNQQPPAGNPPPTGSADTRKPVIKLAIPKQKLRRIVKKGFVCTFSTDEPGRATARFGKFGSVKFTAKKAGKQRCVIKLSKKAKKKLAKLKKLRVTVTVTVKDAAGNVGKKSKKLTLKR